MSEEHREHDVTVLVYAPRVPEPKTLTWPLDWTVGQAALKAAEAFGITGGNPTLGHGDDIFARDKTLRAEHVHSHEHLELLDVGGGV